MLSFLVDRVYSDSLDEVRKLQTCVEYVNIRQARWA